MFLFLICSYKNNLNGTVLLKSQGFGMAFRQRKHIMV